MQSQVSEFLSVWIYPLAEAGVLVAAGFWGSGFLGRIAVRMARNAKLSEALARFLGQAARYLVLAVAFITAASAVGLETTSSLRCRFCGPRDWPRTARVAVAPARRMLIFDPSTSMTASRLRGTQGGRAGGVVCHHPLYAHARHDFHP